MAQLQANSFEVDHDSSANDAEIVIINTCGFIDNAKEESINTIINYIYINSSIIFNYYTN